MKDPSLPPLRQAEGVEAAEKELKKTQEAMDKLVKEIEARPSPRKNSKASREKFCKEKELKELTKKMTLIKRWI